METRTADCPNCAAPLKFELGQVEVLCEFCGSRLRMVPDSAELEVVRTREEMKRRERVDVQKAILRKQLSEQEAERWRQAAAKVAIAAMPIVGESMGRGLFRAALGRSGCAGCGCGALPILAVLAAMFSRACF